MADEARADIASAAIKACCAAFYRNDLVRLLLGEFLHPGGLELTERLGRLLDLRPGSLVLDVAAGGGASARHVAERFGCKVIPLDFGAAVPASPGGGTLRSGDGAAGPVIADAEMLPIAGGSVDAVLCECAFCTFPDKDRAAAEYFRVLRPGGKLGLADITRRGQLPSELDSLFAWVACLGGAETPEAYQDRLRRAGFAVQTVEQHPEALEGLVRQVRRRLLAAEVVTKLGGVALPEGIDWEGAKSLARHALDAVQGGVLGYVLLVGEKH